MLTYSVNMEHMKIAYVKYLEYNFTLNCLWQMVNMLKSKAFKN